MAEPGRMHGLIWRSRAIADKEINDAILAVQALQICTTRNRENRSQSSTRPRVLLHTS